MRKNSTLFLKPCFPFLSSFYILGILQHCPLKEHPVLSSPAASECHHSWERHLLHVPVWMCHSLMSGYSMDKCPFGVCISYFCSSSKDVHADCLTCSRSHITHTYFLVLSIYAFPAFKNNSTEFFFSKERGRRKI